MEDKPTENRIYTGTDAEFSAEQVVNLLKSPEFAHVQEAKMKEIVDNYTLPQVQQAENERQVMMSFELIRTKKHGTLLIGIMKCRYFKMTHKRIAKLLMKNQTEYFSSLSKAISFVKDMERRAIGMVKEELSKPIITL